MSVSRGSALAETALVVSLALMVVFNAFQLALLGFYQLHADASAFLGARVQGLADATAAQTAISATLPATFSTTQNLTLGTKTSQAVVSHRWDGLLLPGASGATVTGEHLEPVAQQSTVTTGFGFSVPPTTLPNYFPQGDVDDPATRYATAYTSMYLAQNLGSGNGNGWNGAFAEWRTHEQCFAKVPFPQNYADTQSGTTATAYVVDAKTNPWSNFPNASVEATIYGWDSGKHTGSC